MPAIFSSKVCFTQPQKQATTRPHISRVTPDTKIDRSHRTMVIMDYSALQDGEGTPCFPPSHPPTPSFSYSLSFHLIGCLILINTNKWQRRKFKGYNTCIFSQEKWYQKSLKILLLKVQHGWTIVSYCCSIKYAID